MTWNHGEIDFDKAQCIARVYLASLAQCSAGTRSVHRTTVEHFIAHFGSQRPEGFRQIVIDKPQLIQWMVQDAMGRTIKYAAERLGVLRRFLQTLHEAGLLAADVFAEFQARQGNCCCRSIAQAVQANNPSSAVASLEIRPTSPGPLQSLIEKYLELQRSVGKNYRCHQLALKHLDCFLKRQSIFTPQDVTPALVQQWADTFTCGAASRINKLHFARRFFNHLRSLNVITDNPVTVISQDWNRRLVPPFRPFIFTKPQVASILTQARQLSNSHQFPLRAETCHTMLTLLYGLGLRHGEARRLLVTDLDLGRQTLLIRETKFHKSRYVPFGPKIGQCLEQFLNKRRTVLVPAGNDAPLFITKWQTPVSHHTLMNAFRAILQGLEISPLQAPRLHDLRHSFAVHRLLRWYREGVDVQSRLPTLSTFLGHVHITSTQVYLTITMDLLQEANDRFHQHFGKSLDRAWEATS